ncbi:unnamed protein product [Rotaria magnacalcarata]|uniref:Uncharacterized protein n=1 Tax=Rotaria magnacalcarata TaxID=392030 RepID=A0A816T3G0_9BILA|nr:unnamed protein product [Rotaria magnacalcarata]CAF2069052.1 unnamed protein product [Rotaria magnacalcarata]CAF2092618.1 unnamed protein product [Rotaria magnacalcarata]CAF5164826.1 unnamed protein product [Rotaria magnacalcarata]
MFEVLINLASPENGTLENDAVTIQTAGPQHVDNLINSSLLKFPENENSNNTLPQHCILKFAVITEQRKSKLV